MGLKRITGLMVACMLFAGAAAACSSTKKTSVSAGASTTTTASSTGQTTSSGSTSGSGSGSGSGSSSGSGNSAKCVAAGEAYAKAMSGEEAALTPGKTFNPAQLQQEYDAAASLIPSNLKGDYDTLGNAIKQFVAAMKGVDLSNPASLANPATAAKLQAAGQTFSSPQVKAASSALGTYFESQCK
jgi:hypothetical protein